MRKYLLIMSAGCIGWLATGAQAACPVFPTCEEMGYTMTATDCSGRATLKCPSDHAKVFCIADSSTECQIGSVLYNDLKCYDEAPSGKTAIGIVFDTSKRLAISLDSGKNSISWGSSADISGLDNCTGSNYTSCGTDGQSNTQKIIAVQGESASLATVSCYTSTYGSLPKGSWFLPSASELKTLHNNRTQINTGITAAGFSSTISTASIYYWSSTERNSYSALLLGLRNGKVSGGKFKNRSLSDLYARCAVKY